MPRKSYTILILTGDRSRFRQLHVSRGLLGAIAGVLILVVLAVLSVPQMALRLRERDAAREAVLLENEALKAQKSRFEEDLARLATRLEHSESQAGRLAAELGVEELLPEPAAGGGDGAPLAEGAGLLDAELDSLAHRTEKLETSLSELDQVHRERVRVLASTPNSLPVKGWFSHGFGWRKDPWTGKREFHRGIDIVADAGTVVLAPADGIVSQATRKSDYGKMIDLSHGYGYVTRYGHLSEVLVRPGQRVQRGDVIGRVGSTGRSTGPHLHYEVFRDGRRVNPWKYLGQR